jgi:hypothetical protein
MDSIFTWITANWIGLSILAAALLLAFDRSRPAEWERQASS